MDNRAVVLLMQRRRRRYNGGNPVAGLLLRLALLAVLGSLLLFTTLAAGAVVSAVGVYAYFTQDLPEPEMVGVETIQESFKTTKIYDRTGKVVLYEIYDPYGGNRTLVPLSRIPDYLKTATIVMEDKHFYTNPGFDIRGLARAFINNLRGLPVQGASSITQQLIKNVIIPPEERMERSYRRKIKELILAWELSRRYPGRAGKDMILEWYLNTINYGNLAYGVQAAAETYFGKDVSELTLAEAAMLVPIPQYPAINPLSNDPVLRQKAIARRNLVLDQMYLHGYLTAEEAYAAKQEPYIPPKRVHNETILAPHFVMYVRRILEERFGSELLYRGGLRVYTTLDLDWQSKAEEVAKNHIRKLQEEERDVTNAAVVVLDPRTAEIKAMMGSLDYFDPTIDGQVNMAISPRQPGSAFKPFTYVTAFMQGYTPATLVMDVRTSFSDEPYPPYAPENYDRRYHGPVLLRYALANSYNIPAVKLMHLVGVRNVIDTAHRMGINTLTRDDYGLSLTLGGGEISLLDMVYAYSVFANMGIMRGEPVPLEKRRPGFRELDPVAILRVEDSNGNVLYEYKGPEERQILPPQPAYLINDILSDNRARLASFGANNKLQISRPAAVKTGSTNDWRDAWTIGYTPQIVIGVWVGNADNHPMKNVPGSRGAAPIWHDLAEYILASMPEEDFFVPDGLVQVEVCSKSGLLPTDLCPERHTEIFIEGTEPKTYCNIHQKVRICKPSGKLATVYCPPDQVEEKVFEIYPAEAADWVRENEIPQPPREYDDTYGPVAGTGDVAIITPRPYSYLKGTVTIQGNAKGDNFQLYQVQYGEGLDPSAWIQIGGDHHNPVDHGVLEYWDGSGLEGLYSLRLLVRRWDGSVQEQVIQVSVDNTPPEVVLVYPWQENVYVLEENEWVNIQATAHDNLAVDRVEFFVDDELVGVSTVPPYNYKWRLKGEDLEGDHKIHAVAYDKAGNSAETLRVDIKVKKKEEEQKAGGGG